MAGRKRWRVILRGKVVATFGHVDRAMERAQALANLYGVPVEVQHRPAGYQAAYRSVVRPRPADAEVAHQRFLDEARRATMDADRYAGSSAPDVQMEAQGE